MCDQCFLDDIYGFNSEVVFKAFEQALAGKINDQKMTKLEAGITYRNVPLQAFTCSNCEALWYLSDPIRSSIRANWYGFFLQKDMAEHYIDRLTVKARKKAFVLSSIVVCVLILALLIHAIYFK